MMITTNLIGGLGNNLFQIAAAYALAKRNQDDFLLPSWKYAEFFNKMKPYNGEVIEHKYYQKGHHYEPVPYQKNMQIFGYYQSEKFFNDCDIKTLLYPICDKKFPFSGNTCSIHVRRGDYVAWSDYFHILNLHYYDYCIERIRSVCSDVKFLVFSDDINWCKLAFGNKFTFIEGNSDIEDFSWMCQCTHNIIANSTFSWWAAWLNKNPDKTVYSPHKTAWLGPAFSYLSTEDIVPENWATVESKTFDEGYYLGNNPDVAHVINHGWYRLGYEHYAQYGHVEGRTANWL